MGTKVRVLVQTKVDGQTYEPNAVVDFPVAVAKSLEKAGSVDSSDEAVAYCVNELGVAVVVHPTASRRGQSAGGAPSSTDDTANAQTQASEATAQAAQSIDGQPVQQELTQQGQ